MSMGYVYILTNPSFREDWVKIGKTRRPVNVRSAGSGEGSDLIATVNCHTTICIRRRYERIAKER